MPTGKQFFTGLGLSMITAGVLQGSNALANGKEKAGTIGGLLGGMTLYPQVLINVPLSKGFVWTGNPAIVAAKRDIEARLSGEGRVLLRASGTEPLLRVMVEGRDEKKVRDAAEALAAIVREAVGD